jgi:hypothetical protein
MAIKMLSSGDDKLEAMKGNAGLSLFAAPRFFSSKQIALQPCAAEQQVFVESVSSTSSLFTSQLSPKTGNMWLDYIRVPGMEGGEVRLRAFFPGAHVIRTTYGRRETILAAGNLRASHKCD